MEAKNNRFPNIRKVLVLSAIAVIAVGWLLSEALAYERFPIYVVDSDGEPQTNISIRAAAAGGPASDTLSYDPAVEVGAGQYYFKIGTGSMEVPPGYYDVYRNSVLSAAWTNIYLGLGNVPAANSLDSTHVKDGGLMYTSDMNTVYGSSTTKGGRVMLIDWDTKVEDTSTGNVIEVTAQDWGTGNYISKVSIFDGLLESTGKDDDYQSPRVFNASVVTDTDYPTEVTDYAQSGGIGVKSRVRCSERGKGMDVWVQSGSSLTPVGTITVPMEVAGYNFFVAADSLGSWWAPPSTHQVAGVAGRMNVKCVPEAIGYFVDISADSTVPWVHGAHLRVSGSGGTYPDIAYGCFTQVEANEIAYGFKTNPEGHGADARTYGLHAQATHDETEGVANAQIFGAYLEAAYEAVGSDQPGPLSYGLFAVGSADTAYGAYCRATSDNTSGANRAYGVLGTATRAPANYGIYGKAANATNATSNFGVYGYAANATNNYGVYGASDGSVGTWAGFFTGGAVGMDSCFMPVSDPPNTAGFVYHMYITPQSAGHTAYCADLSKAGSQYGFYGTGGASDYGLYLAGCDAYVGDDLDCVGDIDCGGNMSLGRLTVNGAGSYPMCGLATVSSTGDSVNVSTQLLDGKTKADVVIIATPLDNPIAVCVTNIGAPTASQFTIKQDPAASTNTEVYWELHFR